VPSSLKSLPEEIELYRDRKWRRENALRVDSAEDVEHMVEELGFCLGLTDARTNLPSVFTAVCGRRDAHLPRNVQKDEEASRAWVLKDEVIARGRVYYAKLLKGKSWFVAPRLIPAFNAIWGVPKAREERDLSGSANKILKVLRNEWEMASADLRAEAGITTRPRFNKALDKLQLTMKVVPQEVVYIPRFTYIWTLAEARFPKEMKVKIPRDKAVRELARAYLTMCGMTLLGDLARTFSLTRREAGRANHELVDEGFAEGPATGIYKLRSL
jgi:hypothetical protein